MTTGVTALGLPHNPTRSRPADNVGYLVELAGLRILHVGDADPSVETYRLVGIHERVDVAIVPFWYLTAEWDSLRRLIAPRIWVATHVPPKSAAQVRREVSARVPGAVVLTQPGEEHTLR